MPTLTFLNETYSCARAQKGSDFVRLLDENNNPIFYAEGITDFTPYVLSGGSWETPIAVIAPTVGAYATKSGNTIALTIPSSVTVETDLQVNFKAPCDCSSVNGLKINGVSYTMVDAAGNSVTGKTGTWLTGALVSVILDVENKKAYLQNTPAYNRTETLKPETAALFGLGTTAVPDDVFSWIGKWGNSDWKLLAEFNTAGAYTFTVPSDVDELGVFILGGGASGALRTHLYFSQSTTLTASGGDSGGLTQIVLRKATGEFSGSEKISVVVGAGGVAPLAPTGDGKTKYSFESVAGGTSSFKGIISEGGQLADAFVGWAPDSAPFGLMDSCVNTVDGCAVFAPTRSAPFGYNGRNIFDPHDTHVYCGAGGGVRCQWNVNSSSGATESIKYNVQTTVERTKGKAGAGSTTKPANNATAPGDGGGGVVTGHFVDAPSFGAGNGADGLVMVYGRKVV